MFDFSIGKVAILFALCLMVLGPEKLPKLAQQLGRLAGQARAMARHFRTQLEQEIAADELAKQRKELEESVQNSIGNVSSPISSVTQAVDEVKQEIAPVIESFDPSSANGSGHQNYDPANDAALDVNDSVARSKADEPVQESLFAESKRPEASNRSST